jgi:hypothetical protein
MYRNLLSTLKKSLWAICVSALLIAVGLFFHWFYVLAAGVIVAITTIIFIVEELKHGDDTAFIAIGFLLTVVFGIVAFFYHGERYISPHGHKQHIYSDCPSIISSSSAKEVTELEGFFYLTFSDCKICKERSKAEKASMIATKKQQESDELKAYLNDLIESLDNGANPKDIKQQLQADWGPDNEDEDVAYPDQP